MPVQQSLRKWVNTADGRKWNSLAILVFLVCAALMTADIVILHLRGHMLPESAPGARPQRVQPTTLTSTNYSDVLRKNIFSPTGEIPPALGQSATGSTLDADPVLSRLPLTLVGTIVHVNEARSIATVQVASQNTVLPVMAGDPIESMGTAVRVERGRLVFRNSNNNQLEYIELPREEGLRIGRSAPQAPSAAAGSADVAQVRENEFRVDRSYVQNALGNLESILQDARTVPVNGGAGGFRFESIRPGSIFETLGLQAGDVLKGVNGEVIDSPTKGFQLFQTLRNSRRIELRVERNGRTEDLVYNID